MSLNIMSQSGWYSARLADAPSGIKVEVWRHHKPSHVRTLMHRTTLDCPLHVAIVKMAALIDALPWEARS